MEVKELKIIIDIMKLLKFCKEYKNLETNLRKIMRIMELIEIMKNHRNYENTKILWTVEGKYFNFNFFSFFTLLDFFLRHKLNWLKFESVLSGFCQGSTPSRQYSSTIPNWNTSWTRSTWLYTGCPTKHETVARRLERRLWLLILFAAFTWQPNFRSKILEIVITK